MDIFSLITSMESDRISSEKLEALKQALMQQLEQFDHVTHPPDGIKEARQNRAELNKLRRSIEEQRKEIRRNCLEPYTAVEPRFKELVALIDEPLERINAFIEENTPAEPEEEAVTGYQILKIIGTPEQMTALMAQVKKLGMGVEVLEDGMPAAMTELTEPSFNSFVAFDIETTGTYGVDNGDAPAEITEIGAVKVVNGQIVERFSALANPGREIVPGIARLTHITNEMVQDKPPIDEVIREFKEFVGDAILVGHNIKSCDIPHITKAAKRAGVAFTNDYFDTYRYAKQLKEAMGWENVKLEYLARQFGVSQPDAHRAWCDAEANVGVYFGLREHLQSTFLGIQNCYIYDIL